MNPYAEKTGLQSTTNREGRKVKKSFSMCMAVLMALGVFAMSACDKKEKLPDGVTFAIDFEKTNVVVNKKINFDDDQNLVNRYLAVREPSQFSRDGNALIIDYADVPNKPNWCIAGIHFDRTWGEKKYFTETKRITFEFYSEVEYPLVTNTYGFNVEFAWKVKTPGGIVTDANYILYTVPFGIPNTNGKWKKATINIDEVNISRFSGIGEDENGAPTNTDYVLEWIMLGPTWDVEPELWESTGKGRVMIDNIYFWNTTDTSIDEVPPAWGSQKVVVTDLVY